MTECVVGGNEEPAIPAGRNRRAAGRTGEHVGIEVPVHAVGRALLAGDGRGRRLGDEHFVLLAHDGLHREPNGRAVGTDNHVDTVLVKPLTGDPRTDIGLVLMVGNEGPHLKRRTGLRDLIDRLPRAGNGQRSEHIAVDTVLPVKRWMLILAAPDMAERVGVLATVKDKAHCRARVCGPP